MQHSIVVKTADRLIDSGSAPCEIGAIDGNQIEVRAHLLQPDGSPFQIGLKVGPADPHQRRLRARPRLLQVRLRFRLRRS